MWPAPESGSKDEKRCGQVAIGWARTSRACAVLARQSVGRRTYGCWCCSRWGQTGSKARKIGCTLCGRRVHEFSVCRGRWERNRTGALQFWSTRRAVPCRPIQSQSGEPPCAFTWVSSHTVSFRSVALLPFLLPPLLSPPVRKERRDCERVRCVYPIDSEGNLKQRLRAVTERASTQLAVRLQSFLPLPNGPHKRLDRRV